MLRLRAAARDERGESLVEIMVAVVILGIAAVAMLSGLWMSVKASNQNRNEATGGAYVRSFAEAIQNHIDSSGYASCGAALATYQGVAVPDLPGSYTKAVANVQSWNGSAWAACTADGIQRVQLTVTSDGDATHRVSETLTVILRRPCNGPATTSASDPCA